MLTMKKYLPVVLGAAMVASGCSTMTPARYSVSVDANQQLKRLVGTRVVLTNLAEPPSQDINCRLMGPIQAGDGMTVTGFIQKAFNDEFKFADLYDQTGHQLEGRVTKIQFSSSSGLTNGWWELGLVLNSESGATLSTNIHHDFKSGFDAITACNQTAQALGAAVQDLVVKTVSNPGFEALFE